MNQCPATTTDNSHRTHKVIQCQREIGHDGQHFAAVGGSQRWRQYSWPVPEAIANVGSVLTTNDLSSIVQLTTLMEEALNAGERFQLSDHAVRVYIAALRRAISDLHANC